MAIKGEGFQSTCRDCQRDMRPQYVHADEWPGTVLHGGLGYCYNCRRKMRAELAAAKTPGAPQPPRELDDREKIALRMLEKMGAADDEMRSMLGFNDNERPQPLSDIQMMRNSLTSSGGGTFGVFSESDTVLRNAVAHGSVKGRRL